MSKHPKEIPLLKKLEIESAELQTKINKLSSFLESDECQKLSVHHKNLLRVQLRAMCDYSNALVKRMADLAYPNNRDKNK